MEMLGRLRKGTQNESIITWPGTEAQLVMVPLNCDELQDAYAEANERFKQLGLEITLYTADDFYSELAMQILVRAMRCIEDETRKSRLFASGDELRGAITPDERTALNTAYIDLNDRCNPDPQKMSDELFRQIDEAVKKKDAIQLSSFGSSTLAIYMLGMDNMPLS